MTTTLLPVTQADRDAAADFAETCTKYSFVWTEAPVIRRGQHDEWEIVQALARHRQSHALRDDAWAALSGLVEKLEGEIEDRFHSHLAPAMKAARAALTPSPCPGEPAFVRDDQCNVEFGTVPDCDCPHEHWHVGGICLDVHIEEDRTGHAILGNDDWQLEVSGVENLDEMRAIAFAWAKQKYALTPSALSGDAGEVDAWMTISVDEAAQTIGIDHPTKADWLTVYRGMVAVRDHINDRIAKQEWCPVRPAALSDNEMDERQ